jgi:predicted RNA-binding Zn ribbon-like protein
VIGALVSVIQHAMLDGRLQRLKACKHCGWVFHDASRSRSGQWCTMAICGNRAKNRAHRQRHEPPEKPAS